MTSLKGKTLFISGASRGIGLAIALRAARDGANVAIAAKTTEPHPRLKGTIYTAAEKLAQPGIRPSFNMIFGFPGEGEPERRESIKLIMDVCRKFPGAEFWTNIFTPYPGSPIMQRAAPTSVLISTFNLSFLRIC